MLLTSLKQIKKVVFSKIQDPSKNVAKAIPFSREVWFKAQILIRVKKFQPGLGVLKKC